MSRRIPFSTGNEQGIHVPDIGHQEQRLTNAFEPGVFQVEGCCRGLPLPLLYKLAALS